jgi:hypothetical protein
MIDMETNASPARASQGPALDGTASQVEWAERIKREVNTEFDRVARAFRSVANSQHGVKRAETENIITILEDKRSEVMNNHRAGYFIRDWQEISDQVRQMIFSDPRYQSIKSNRATPKTTLGRLAAL